MKKFIIPALSLAAFLSMASSSFADTTVQTCATGFSALCNLNTGNFAGLIGNLLQLIIVISIIVALLYLVWGGFKWLTSGGDKGQVQAAREHIVAAIVGLVIIFLAYLVINLLLGFFGLGNLNTLVLPTISTTH